VQDRGAWWLMASGVTGLVTAVVVASTLLFVFGPGWFSAARIAGLLAVIAFSAAFFSAAAGRRSAAASAASELTARRAYGQQLYELARSVHEDLTTGEVAEARDRLGTLVRARRRLWGNPIEPHHTHDTAIRDAYDPSPDGHRMAQLRRDWFTLLWCFQRVNAALDLLAEAPSEVAHGRQRDPRNFLADLIRDQVRFLNTDATDVRAALEEYDKRPVDDRESSQAFRDLVAVLLRGVERQRWRDPVTTQDGETLRSLLYADPRCRRLLNSDPLRSRES
jgi:hypothetical protein